MRKLKFIILILSTLYISCTDDEDMKIMDTNKISIFGEWKPIKVVRVCSSGNNEVINLNDCRENSRLIFNSDTSFDWSVYSSNSTGCSNILNYSGNFQFINNEQELLLDFENETNNDMLYTYLLVKKNTLLLGNSSNCKCEENYDMLRQYTEYIRIEKQ